MIKNWFFCIVLILCGCGNDDKTDTRNLFTYNNALGSRLVVYTLNIHASGDNLNFEDHTHFPMRIKGVAQGIYEDYPDATINGLIGLQEARTQERMTGCLAGVENVYGPRCLAQELEEASGYWMRGEGESAWAKSPRGSGVVTSWGWKIIEKAYWELEGPILQTGNYLLEVLVQHRSEGWRLRFYSVHMYANKDYRSTINARKVIDIITRRAQLNELPPILVGDFNGERVYENGEPPFLITALEEHFWRPMDILYSCCENKVGGSGIDDVYVGRKSSFPESLGSYRVIKRRGLEMREPVEIEGSGWVLPLSDHNLNGFVLEVEGGINEPPLEVENCEGADLFRPHPNVWNE